MVPELRLGLAAMSACTYCGTVFSLLAATFLVVLVALLWPVIYPTTEPLEIFAGTDRLGDRELPVRRQGSVIFAGSYNPPHKGHVAMLTHLSRRYEKVFAVIGFNASKTYTVTPEQRCAVLQTMVSHLANVEPVAVRGYIWRFAYAQRVIGVYRGIRTWEQDGRAERLLELQNRLGPALVGLRWPYATTFLCLPDANHAAQTQLRPASRSSTCGSALNVSSSDVRSRLANRAGIEDLVGNKAASAQIREFWSPPSNESEKTRVHKALRSTKMA